MSWKSALTSTLTIPPNFSCTVLLVKDLPCSTEITTFINTHNMTSTGNITMLSPSTFNRFTHCPIAILKITEQLIGILISVVLPINSHGRKLYSSYNTFLCLHSAFQGQQLAPILIATMKEYLATKNITHTYFMTSKQHTLDNFPIKAWYRPINVVNSLKAGFELQSFARPQDRNPKLALTRQKIAYGINQPAIIGVKARVKDQQRVLKLLKLREEYLDVTGQEYKRLLQIFDIYIVADVGLYLLMPMTSKILSTGQIVNNYQLALMIGPVLDSVLWTVKELNADLLYGWTIADIDDLTIQPIRGILAAGDLFIESYSSVPGTIDNGNKWYFPVF